MVAPGLYGNLLRLVRCAADHTADLLGVLLTTSFLFLCLAHHFALSISFCLLSLMAASCFRLRPADFSRVSGVYIL